MKRTAVVLAFAYFIAMTVLVTFPGLSVANRVEPYILGLPFVLAWFMGWMIGALVVLFFLHRAFDT